MERKNHCPEVSVLGCICCTCRWFPNCNCDDHFELFCPDLTSKQYCHDYEPINKKENENHV